MIALRLQWFVFFAAVVLGLQSCAALPKFARHDASSEQSADRLFVLLGQADAAYQRQQWDHASALYQQVLRHMPEDPYAWFRLGNALTQNGQYYKAIFAFETSLQHDARQTKPWFNLSTAHLLGAQLATLKALDSMGKEDSGREQMLNRLNTLTMLLQ